MRVVLKNLYRPTWLITFRDCAVHRERWSRKVRLLPDHCNVVCKDSIGKQWGMPALLYKVEAGAPVYRRFGTSVKYLSVRNS